MSEENVECFSKEEMSLTQDNQERAERAILDLPVPNKGEEEMEVVETLMEENKKPIDDSRLINEGSATVMKLISSVKEETGNEDYLQTLKSENPDLSVVSIKEEEDSSDIDYQVKQEIEDERMCETISIETPLINSYYSMSTNTIVKTELDLGVTTGVYYQELDPSVCSYSICPIEQQVSKDVPVLDPFHDVMPKDKYTSKRWSKRGQFLCKMCDYRSNIMMDITIHVERLHSEKYNYRCFICATIAYDEEVKIRSENKIRDPVEITYSQYEHKSLRALQYHVGTVHRGLKLLLCPNCDRIFPSSRALKTHRGKSHKEKLFECRYCSFKCESQHLLDTHWSTHVNTYEQCPICMKKISQVRLSFHLESHKNNQKPKRSKKKIETCQVCGVSGFRPMMERHYKNTRHCKSYVCQYCKYGVNSEELLIKHLKTHKLHVCPFPSCGKQFYREHDYNVHHRLHTTKKKIHKCPAEECDFQTLAGCTLTLHLRKTKHHYRFKCHFCSLRIRTKERLRDHLKHCNQEVTPSKEQEVLKISNIEDQITKEQYRAQITHFSQGWLGLSMPATFDSEEVLDTSNSPPKNSVEAPENSIEAPENTFEAPENSVEAPENSIEAPENTFEAPENSVEAPENSIEAPENTFEAPENSVEAPENSIEAPENPFEAPENSIEEPANTFEAPQDSNSNDSDFFTISEI